MTCVHTAIWSLTLSPRYAIGVSWRPMQTATCEQSGPCVQTIEFMQARRSTLRRAFTDRGFLKSEAGCVRAFEASSCCLQLPWGLIVVANTPASFNTVTVYSGVDEPWQEGQDLLCVATRNWPAHRDSFECCSGHWQVIVQCDGVADTICFVIHIRNCCSVGSCSNVSMLSAMSKA